MYNTSLVDKLLNCYSMQEGDMCKLVSQGVDSSKYKLRNSLELKSEYVCLVVDYNEFQASSIQIIPKKILQKPLFIFNHAKLLFSSWDDYVYTDFKVSDRITFCLNDSYNYYNKVSYGLPDYRKSWWVFKEPRFL